MSPLNKLFINFGIVGKLNTWIKAFLCGLTQSVKIASNIFHQSYDFIMHDLNNLSLWSEVNDLILTSVNILYFIEVKIIPDLFTRYLVIYYQLLILLQT